MSLVKGTAQPTKMSSGSCVHSNKCHDTAAPCVGLANDSYSSKWFVISSSPLLQCLV
jgi:hypothetical protein